MNVMNIQDLTLFFESCRSTARSTVQLSNANKIKSSRPKSNFHHSSNLIKIHDQYYNVTNFLDKHPGGSKILESCIGIDATASFESYHALSDFQRIRTIMKKYQTEPPTEPKDFIESAKYTFATNDFYSDVKLKVNEYFKTNKKSTKWTWIWLLYFVVT